MAPASRYFDFIDHTADIIVRACGPNRTEAFAAAAEALFDLITDSARIEGDAVVRFEVESIDIEGLLVGFLSELIVIHETEDVVLSDFAIEIRGDTMLICTARSERFDPSRHGEGTPVKGVSYHNMTIGKLADGVTYCVHVLVDI